MEEISKPACKIAPKLGKQTQLLKEIIVKYRQGINWAIFTNLANNLPKNKHVK